MGRNTYLLDVDSSQRDIEKYPDTNDYVININRPLYNISSIKLVTGRIPLSQYTIDSFNSNVTYDNTLIELTERNYLTGNALASNVQEQFRDTLNENSITVEFDSNTQTLSFSNTTDFSLTFGDNSPAAVWGFLPGTYGPETSIVSSAVDLDGPQSLLISVNGDERDDIKTELYFADTADRPVHFFGRIATTAYTTQRFIDHNGNDDPVFYDFPRGNENYIKTIHVSFHCNNFQEIHPYDFKGRNHMLKFEITCDLDKFNTLEKKVKAPSGSLPPKIEIARFNEQYRFLGQHKRLIVYAGTILVFILLLVLMPKRGSRQR